jgi:hypothetical protein
MRYLPVVFMQGEEYAEIADRGEMFEHLVQWDTGEYPEVHTAAPWGRGDRTYEYGPDYVLAVGRDYVSLNRVLP